MPCEGKRGRGAAGKVKVAVAGEAQRDKPGFAKILPWVSHLCSVEQFIIGQKNQCCFTDFEDLVEI